MNQGRGLQKAARPRLQRDIHGIASAARCGGSNHLGGPGLAPRFARAVVFNLALEAQVQRYLAVDSKTLQPEAFAVLANHPTLEYLDAGLRTVALSGEPNQMLDLPRDFGHKYNQLILDLADRIDDI